MSTKKKPIVIKEAAPLGEGKVRLTFNRPHGVPGAGVVIKLHNGPHLVVHVGSRVQLTVKKLEPKPAPEAAQPEKPAPLKERVREAVRVLAGRGPRA